MRSLATFSTTERSNT